MGPVGAFCSQAEYLCNYHRTGCPGETGAHGPGSDVRRRLRKLASPPHVRVLRFAVGHVAAHARAHIRAGQNIRRVTVLGKRGPGGRLINGSDQHVSGKPRLLHLVHTPRHSGAETLVRELCIIHQARGIDTAITSFSPSDPDFLLSIAHLQTAGVQLFLPERTLAGVDRIRAFRRVYRDFRPQLVYGHSVLPSLYGRLALPLFGNQPRFVSVLHSATNDDYEEANLWGAELLLARRNHRVFAVSEEGASNYRKRIPYAPQVDVVPNGTNIGGIREAAARRDVIRGAFNLQPHTRIILQVGRISSTKQQLHALEALTPLLKERNQIKLWFAGLVQDEFYAQAIRAKIAESDLAEQVAMLGSREDIPDLLSAADLYIMPSLMEAHSVAMIEALASGIAVAASDIPTLRFSSTYKGVILHPAADKHAMAKAAEALLVNQKRFARNLAEFDISVTADKYASGLSKIAARS